MSENRPVLCIAPRWAANQDMEWYSWLCETDVVRGGFEQVLRPDLEDYETPTIEAWVSELQRTLADPAALARTYLVGHSVSCQAIVRYLGTLPGDQTVAGCLLVAGWWQLDEAWGSILPWQLDPEQARGSAHAMLERARAACSRYQVLISDNDPFTKDWEGTRSAWQEYVGAEVQIVPGAEHFNGAEMPVVAEALAALIR